MTAPAPEALDVIAVGAHEWLGLDYRDSTEPAIVYQEDEDAEIEHVASSFEELLAGLTED